MTCVYLGPLGGAFGESHFFLFLAEKVGGSWPRNQPLGLANLNDPVWRWSFATADHLTWPLA